MTVWVGFGLPYEISLEADLDKQEIRELLSNLNETVNFHPFVYGCFIEFCSLQQSARPC